MNVRQTRLVRCRPLEPLDLWGGRVVPLRPAPRRAWPAYVLVWSSGFALGLAVGVLLEHAVRRGWLL